MDSETRQYYQVPSRESPFYAVSTNRTMNSCNPPHGSAIDFMPELDYPPQLEDEVAEQILERLRQGQLWIVNSRRRNGLILCKEFHAEFAGPGAAIGSIFDQDCQRVIPVGNLSLLRPEHHKDRQNAYLIRRQWIKLTQQSTDQSEPDKRAQMVLTQFETYFDQETIARIPDEIFALLVGVLPYSIRKTRRTPGKLNVKVKT
ncbi:hypothetical protein [Leptolyngbya sp. ST-U4]|uniref:hypothetical protein n=1 Tax=Leptolyngbya sp. ST-U4 TaxID=2933912 RepID=UPI0019ADE131|nr:hypothetical protein [Cyanobacteria bacterium FACHB-502]